MSSDKILKFACKTVQPEAFRALQIRTTLPVLKQTEKKDRPPRVSKSMPTFITSKKQHRAKFTGEFQASVDKSRVEHPHRDVFELVGLSSHERRLEWNLGERPVSTVQGRVSEIVHIRRTGRYRTAACTRRTSAVTSAYPTNESMQIRSQ